jgi:hypothetical protein
MLAPYRESGDAADLTDAKSILDYMLAHNVYDLSFGGLFAAPVLTGGLALCVHVNALTAPSPTRVAGARAPAPQLRAAASAARGREGACP